MQINECCILQWLSWYTQNAHGGIQYSDHTSQTTVGRRKLINENEHFFLEALFILVGVL